MRELREEEGSCDKEKEHHREILWQGKPRNQQMSHSESKNLVVRPTMLNSQGQGRNMTCGTRRPPSNPNLAVSLWKNHLASLSLCFLICNIGILLIHQGGLEWRLNVMIYVRPQILSMYQSLWLLWKFHSFIKYSLGIFYMSSSVLSTLGTKTNTSKVTR